MTAVTTKRNVDLVDIVSTWMLGQYGFLSRVFAIFEEHKISVDCVATSEISISLTLDKKHQDPQVKESLIADLSKVRREEAHAALPSLKYRPTRTA